MTTVIDVLRAWGVECLTRGEWGSPQEAAGSYAKRGRTHPMPTGPAPYHFLHLTVTSDTDTVREGAAGARQVETYGYSSPPMVSYQDMVTNEGRYFQGQDYGTKGTHTVNDKRISGYPENLNLYGYACALMQNVGDAVTDPQVETVARVFAARELLGLVKRGAPIHPHRKFAWKGCPGDRAMGRLSEIRALKDKYVAEGLPTGEDDDMSWTEELPAWHPGDTNGKDTMSAGQQLNQARGYAHNAHLNARDARRAAMRTEAAVQALAKALGPKVEAAVRDALADAVVDVDVTVRNEVEQ